MVNQLLLRKKRRRLLQPKRRRRMVLNQLKLQERKTNHLHLKYVIYIEVVTNHADYQEKTILELLMPEKKKEKVRKKVKKRPRNQRVKRKRVKMLLKRSYQNKKTFLKNMLTLIKLEKLQNYQGIKVKKRKMPRKKKNLMLLPLPKRKRKKLPLSD